MYIDESHASTQEDPIPDAKGMEYTYSLYYTDPEDGKLYRCERTGEQPGGKVTLQFMPHELVGAVFYRSIKEKRDGCNHAHGRDPRLVCANEWR